LSRDIKDLKEILELVRDLKKRGDGGFSRQVVLPWLIQPFKDRVDPAYEYWGQSDPTRELNGKVSKEDMAARVSQTYYGKVKIKKCLKAHSLKRPADPVRS
jgi:hypothetical protein